MPGSETLRQTLRRIDGRGYKAYADIRGAFDFPTYRLFIDRTQADPFAPPSLVRVFVPQAGASFPPELFTNPSRKLALEDFLARRFSAAAEKHSHRRGTGHSGEVRMTRWSQEILQRTAVDVSATTVEARFFVGLPAYGRRIAAREADDIFFRQLPEVVADSLLYQNLDQSALSRQVELAEDADSIRQQLERRGLVAFVADGAVLPRQSGVSDLPLADAIPFESPAILRVEFTVPNQGRVTGMGIARGVTLIVGGGYHGKSTLLNAICKGVYNHVPGDGRELVVTLADAMKIRAEEGRFVEKVDISPFISNLPFGQDTSAFSTLSASGSTSQAANIVEALEAGSSFLLIDEDTSATNFMIRDERMQALVAKEKEPITPLIDNIRLLYDELGVSTLLVMGGCGDYFDVADTVIMLDSYRAREVTSEAKQVAQHHQTARKHEASGSFRRLNPRCPLPGSFDPVRGRKVRISSQGREAISFGRERIDLSAAEQLVEETQTRAIGWLIHYAAKNLFAGDETLPEILDRLEREIETKGLASLMPHLAGDYARPRPLEIAAAINRLRSLNCAPT